MKKIAVLIGIAMAVSCGETKNNEVVNEAQFDVFGEQISVDNAVEPSQLSAQLEGKDTVKIKLKTKITEVCQKKGCWMNVDLGNSEEMMVRFKDYAFFVPKDAAGREVVVEGLAFHDTTTVEDLRHFAEDAGQTPEEIEKITEPEVSISFEASGVMIRK